MERTGGFRVSALVAAAAVLLFGAGEAFAGAASDVNADTLGCFNQSIGGSPGAIWYLSDSTTGPAQAPAQWTEFGPRSAGYVPVTGKFGGGNADGLGVADATGGTAVFYGLSDATSGTGTADFFGELPVEATASPTTDPVPLAGNWLGNGHPGWGLYYPDAGVFVLDTDPGNPTSIPFFEFGPKSAADVVPIVGDFNGDGNDTVGVYYRPHGRFFLTNIVQQTPGGSLDEINLTKLDFFYGPPGDNWIPIVGDWDLQNGDSVGLYDPDTGTYYLRNTNTSGTANTTVTFTGDGTPTGCVPVAGNWNLGGGS